MYSIQYLCFCIFFRCVQNSSDILVDNRVDILLRRDGAYVSIFTLCCFKFSVRDLVHLQGRIYWHHAAAFALRVTEL
jgi:hypothetical protein